MNSTNHFKEKTHKTDNARLAGKGPTPNQLIINTRSQIVTFVQQGPFPDSPLELPVETVVGLRQG